MPADADIVRCAAPWPGSAAQLLEAFASLGTGTWSPERLCAASITGLDPGDAIQILAGLSLVGLCHRAREDAWSSPVSAGELRRVATLLRGADHYRRLRFGASSASFAVTMPAAPSYLAPEISPEVTSLSTAEAFMRVAEAASESLIVMMPFIDQRGFGWLRAVIQRARALEKILVLRNVDEYAAELAVHHAAWLREQAVSVRDYYLSHPREGGRSLPIETFHAKIVLADDRLAYIGSANLLGSGSGTSLEAGVLVEGPVAARVAGLVAGVLRVARRL